MSLSEPAPSAGDILIIDDTLDNLRFLSDLLTKAGYTVRKVITGEMGLEAAELEPPDLILLDIQLPELTGYEVCERLKLSDRTQHIPVIFLSARDEELDKVIAFETGGVDYITKPFQVVEVLSRIKTHLQVSRLQQQLRLQNEQLSREVSHRMVAEAALKMLNQELETRIISRTEELQTSNMHLYALQTELRKILSHEQQLGTLKSQLIETIAHEFRTPLTTIATAMEWLKQRHETRDEQEHQYIDRVSDQVNRMGLVLQNSLFLAETETPLVIEAVNLNQLCEAFLQQVPLPCQPTYRLTLEAEPQPSPVFTDQALLLKIISHLVANALHYSPNGGSITLKLRYDSAYATLVLEDEGIGIPEAELSQIFERFYRASNANTSAGNPGAGLGLAVVKRAIALLKGTVSVTSTVGQGSSFTLQLPLVP